jgi:chromosomal replication initiator protein
MKPTIRHVQETVAEHFAIDPSAMVCARLDPCNALHLPRQTAMFFARQVTGHSRSVIAYWFNRRNHTTVLHAERKVERLSAENDRFAADLQTIREAIGS